MSAHVERHVIRDHDMGLRHRFYEQNHLGRPRPSRPARKRRRLTKPDRQLREHLAVVVALILLAIAWQYIS